MRRQTPFTPTHAVTGIAGIFLGIIVGYVMGAAQIQPAAPLSAAASDDHVHSSPAASLVNEHELKAYRDILAGDPRNLKALIGLGDRLYDAGRFAEAIPYYTQAFELDTSNVSVSTDLGTAMYYAGRLDDALAQLERSLKIDPAHAQTLFNIGIMQRDGRKDTKAAVEAWERLLEVAPDYLEAARVRTMIDQTR